MVGKSSLTLSAPSVRRRSRAMERVLSGRMSAGASLTGTVPIPKGDCPLFLCLQRQLDDPLLGQAEGVVVPVMALDGLGIALLGQHLLAQGFHRIQDLLDEVWTDLHAALPQRLGVLGQDGLHRSGSPMLAEHKRFPA